MVCLNSICSVMRTFELCWRTQSNTLIPEGDTATSVLSDDYHSLLQQHGSGTTLIMIFSVTIFSVVTTLSCSTLIFNSLIFSVRHECIATFPATTSPLVKQSSSIASRFLPTTRGVIRKYQDGAKVYNLNNVFAKSLSPISLSGHGFEPHNDNDDEVCF